ncbi:MAG: restriction endonuclease subunit S [Hylemonella sp.]|nr:restriction endonuclease subunit S [Hylemonella sp.]
MEVKEPTQRYLAAADRQLTEIGLLPGDWYAERLGNVSTCVIGLTYSPADVADHGTLVLRSSNIQGGRLALSDCVFVRMALPDRVITREGDLLVCVRNGSSSLIGKAALIDSSAAGSAFGAFMSVLRSSDGPYLRQVFDTASLKRQIEQGLGATINQITNRDMDALLVPWPSTAEERGSIGSVLTDADALVDSLEQLLTKKRQIKQGAMQELLTGKRRLPGFTGPVQAIRLGDVCKMQSGGTPAASQSAYFDGPHPWVAISDITQANKYLSITERSLSEAGLNACAAKLFPAGTVLYAMYASVGECCIATVPACTSQAILAMQPAGNLDPEYLYYSLTSSKAKAKSAVQQGTQGNLNKGIVQAMEIRFPEVPEQKAIARALSNMDEEISALESRLTKARSLKQAMAQALLTGRIRLVEPNL